jgi:hypothetical protein
MTLGWSRLFCPLAAPRQRYASTSAILGNKLDAGLFEGFGDFRNSLISYLDCSASLGPRRRACRMRCLP